MLISKFASKATQSTMFTFDGGRIEHYMVTQATGDQPKEYRWSVSIYDASDQTTERYAVAATTPARLAYLVSQVRQQLDENEDVIFVPARCGFDLFETDASRSLSIYDYPLAAALGLWVADRGDMVN